ncbi:MAG: methyl-accepting chemotaxis protein [Cyanobacteria bacterium J06650_10]
MLKITFKKISTQLMLSYAVPLICLAGLGMVASLRARETVQLREERDLIQQSEYLANDATYQLIDATRRAKAYLLRPNEIGYQRLYAENYELFQSNIEQLSVLAEQQNDETLERLTVELSNEGNRLNRTATQMMGRIENRNVSGAVSLLENLESAKVGHSRQALREHLAAQLNRNVVKGEQAQSQLLNILGIGTPVAALITMGLGGLATWRLRQQIRKIVSVVEHNGIQVTTSSTQIAATSRQLEATVTEQAASTTQIAATAAEIAATAEELTQTMAQVMEQSASAATIANEGKAGLVRMEETIQQLTAATSTIATKLGLIDDKANNIGTVVGAITKVADQTNLLSLNAAIEAEKAGEYGAGFSVVAREIRRLADQTALATLEIESMVQEMLASVSTGVMEMDRFTQDVSSNAAYITQISEQVSLIISQVQSLAPQFESVSAGMMAQSEGAQQIYSAMAQLNDTSQQTTESVKDTNQAISQLGEVALRLQSEVANFRVVV